MSSATPRASRATIPPALALVLAWLGVAITAQPLPTHAAKAVPWPLHETHSDAIADTMDVLVAPPNPLASFITLLQTGIAPGIDPVTPATIVANIEGGHIWSGHQSLGHVRQFVNDTTVQDVDKNPLTPEYDRHATGVGSVLGGRIAGDGPLTCPIELHSGAVATKWDGNAYSGRFATTPRAVVTAYEAFFGFADVINSSWGGADPTGVSFASLITDGFANQHPRTTFVVSAGNAGPAPNTVGGPGSGYNNITVGALQKSGSDLYDRVASFSSRGPHDYWDPFNGTIAGVRADVDLVAPGTHLTAAYYGGQTGGNHPALPGSVANDAPNAYKSNIRGTSFAAPIVASGTAQLIDASKNTQDMADNPYARDARVVKSVLLNSADKIPGWNNGQIPHPNGSGGVLTTQALDWASGAGAFHLGRAYEQYILAGTRDVPGLGGGTVASTGWDYGLVNHQRTNVYHIGEILPASTVLTVTVNWFRDRTFTPGIWMAAELGHADLDLIVRDTITNQVVAESISTYNVVEHLSFTLPTRSKYQIEVNYAGNLFGTTRKGEYGLAWSAKPPARQAQDMTTRRRCRWSAPRSLRPGENPAFVCFTTQPRGIARSGSVLPRGGWVVAK